MNPFNNSYSVACDKIIREYFFKKGYRITSASNTEDKNFGIDYIGYIPLSSGKTNKIYIDMKNTKDLYFLNMSNTTFIIRHPFKAHSKTTHYFFVSNHDLILCHDLWDKIFKDKDGFLEILKKLDTKKVQDLQAKLKCNSFEELKKELINRLTPYLNDGYAIYANYDKFDKRYEKYSFKIYEKQV